MTLYYQVAHWLSIRSVLFAQIKPFVGVAFCGFVAVQSLSFHVITFKRARAHTIHAQAYPGRIPFLEFFERFELLQRQLSRSSLEGAPLPSAAHATEEEAKAGCRSILEEFLPDKLYQIGHTRVSRGAGAEDWREGFRGGEGRKKHGKEGREVVKNHGFRFLFVCWLLFFV